ncbi:FeoA family protein [Magnetococcus marinus MC-1]|uniref:FeoA family protein n=1 Tax=Magnetococcus marinus (strain ATCC BAA-1437 / JCM 17883 / MC-1) TaxID=156889 RepID=A0L8E5_MAGMM|nr:FeoA family protein [Magnetococcus marinus]ABK44238.1 FeoA family protein [Magnetococcus marinus MC-1]
MTLVELKKGTKVRVMDFKCSNEERSRFISMGLTPGKEITLRNQAPFGDPRVYTIMGYDLTLRNAEAEKILIEATV